ncbi:MAG: hypothetical protein PHZ09_03280 [Eubacteriales bacterium]|nr:hypothetical protein [Eubacteriales bacterium]
MYRDPHTGTEIRRVTFTPAVHHHPYFPINAYDNAMRRLFYTEHINNRPQIFCEIRRTGELCRLTDADNLNEWSVNPSHNGDYVYFTDKDCGYRVHIETCRTELIVDFKAAAFRNGRGIIAGTGTTALSAEDRYWAVKYTVDEDIYLSITDTECKKTETIMQIDKYAHTQFSPDGNIIYWIDSLTGDVWQIRRDGCETRRLLIRDRSKGQILQIAYISGTGELAVVSHNTGITAINTQNGSVRCVNNLAACQSVCSPDGRIAAACTCLPDAGIYLFNPRMTNGKLYKLCGPDLFNTRNQPLPPVPAAGFVPPAISPDCRYVVFTSDKSGYPQVYEAQIPDNIYRLV